MNLSTRWMLGIALAMSSGAGQAQLVPLTEVVQVAAGNSHTCALTNVGGVKCWGDNIYGQLGDGSTTQRFTPVDVVGLGSGLAAISAGGDHTCVLTSGGGVKCWGGNFVGQLGDGSTASRLTPVDVSGLSSGVAAISAGDDHTCALTTGGGVKCWGFNGLGPLGDGSTTQRLTPVDVSGLASGVAAISAGQDHTCALSATGGLKCWGNNFSGQLGNGGTTNQLTAVDVTGLSSGVATISSGSSHTCALTTSGGVKCWGENGAGQVGDASFTNRLTPVDVTGLTSGVTAISAGFGHNCALTLTGGVKCWGDNFVGQLGDGNTLGQTTPVDVSGLTGVTAIRAGDFHTCALTLAGGVKCWGYNVSGQLGDGSTTKRLTAFDVTSLTTGVTAIDAGNYHTCALTNVGGVLCWGQNSRGQLGDGSITNRLTPVGATGLTSGVAAITAGGNHTCAVTSAGGVKCWGRNSFGQLGDGSTTQRPTAVDATGLTSGVTTISAGLFHTCALTNAGGVKCWGQNFNGKLGDGSTTQRLTAVDVTGLSSGVTAIRSGTDHTCALTTSGGVKCWGSNFSGQLGDNSTTDRLTPVDVTGLTTGVTAISAGESHTCALTTAGGVKCWGFNGGGALGDNSIAQRLTPVDVTSLMTGVVAIDAGGNHTCALTPTGGVKCWGENSYGELGDGSSTQRLIPVDATGLTLGVTAFSAGFEHTCAVTNGGGVKCWGSDERGQIGDGGRNPLVPDDVLVDAASLAIREIVDLTTGGNEMSLAPASDASGRYVVFQSEAGNLGPSNTAGSSDIYRVDTQTGDTLLLSRNDDDSPLGADAIEASVSADGEVAVFVAADAGVSKVANESATKTFARGKAGGFSVLMRNLIANTTQRMSIPALPGGAGSAPQISPGGNAIVYTGPTPAGMGDPAFNAILEVPLIKQPNGSLTLGMPRCLSCKAVNANGSDSGDNANGHSRHATMSADGRYVAWETEAKNLLLGNASPCPDASTEIVLRDLITGVTQRMSAPPSSAQCGAAGTGARKPKIDWSGRKIVFESDQPLKPGDANGAPDIYLRDLSQTSLTRVSETAGGGDAGGASTEPAISGDGQIIGYVSAAADLDSTEADTNAKTDVHVRSLRQALTRRLSKTRDGAEADSDSRRPALNYNGTQLAFDSDAGNLAPGAEAGIQNVFQRANPLNSLTIFATGFD